ncbi:diaminopimelate epimerase [Allorhizocola rhizosphaerae]|uniref:diaminopimelate epimerase n=1 Tax=Allorhizocola rhizosphaerae TaxID=1872709 RepID=UPI000E3CA135|nr:diaminopimelate epimerase [Allorhizocola rhizosphaerae]
MRFTKGHGTGNDFVIVDASVELNPALVRGLCDRRFGIGGDGVLRVARQDALYFMDYWNSDGTIAEMCGNGVRVFVRYLLENALVTGDEIAVATRSGVKTARVEWDGINVDMGPPRILGNSWATLAGHMYEGLGVSMGNPHLVCEVDSVAALDLSGPPELDKDFYPEGANVEFVERVSPDHVRMRVFERGSGETLSCGTGACAVGVVALSDEPGTVAIDVPGGRLRFTRTSDTTWLAGPAVLVATGEFDLSSLAGQL